MGISKKVLKIISESPALQGKIAEAADRGWKTIERWVENNDNSLTTANILEVIREETGLSNSQILENGSK